MNLRDFQERLAAAVEAAPGVYGAELRREIASMREVALGNVPGVSVDHAVENIAVVFLAVLIGSHTFGYSIEELALRLRERLAEDHPEIAELLGA